MRTYAILTTILLAAITIPLKAQPYKATLVERSYVFDTAAFKSCHASTIVNLANGRLLAAWFGGDHEGSPDVCIWAARKTPTGWTAPIKIADGIQADGKQHPCWNPVLFKAKNNKLYLHYKVGPNPREWWAMYKWSADDGKTWSKAIRLPDGFLGPIKNKPVQLANGAVLYPSSEESLDEKSWTIHLEQTDTGVRNWKRIAIDCDTFQTIQPSILLYKGGKMQLLARSKQNAIVQSWSYNYGKSWTPVSRSTLPNPNSGSDAATLKNGLQVLVYNPLLAGKNWWDGRATLKVAVSKDGLTWTDVYTLEDHPKGEYSYPAIIAGTDNTVYITYTADRKRISFVKLRID